MRLDDPEALVSAYAARWMGFLLFADGPRVLMIGLAVARWPIFAIAICPRRA